MKWNQINEQTCSIARSVSIFGDRWTLLILRDIFWNVTKFSELQKSLGITKHRLSDRLNRLVESGVLYKALYDEKRQHFEYKLTEKGSDLYPIILAIAHWGDKWEVDSDGPPVNYFHSTCGKKGIPYIACAECGEELNIANTSGEIGTGILNKVKRGEETGLKIEIYAGNT
ncbi:putative HTH-type transcriptional regulator [Paraglaciecola mesophila]|uniref:Putative HTH-type transcriptional regulator n=1 Tax=Paraglaciecola mesophila TaxID=197222 RepID=A0A857JL51_9ALTE|nr:helix-turn-helix domain-containing protein [Paraglaciecola mesophila]QHJ12266.1 putative HTH-type transcriptional regulator [Paraglaciecola mesophila]